MSYKDVNRVYVCVSDLHWVQVNSFEEAYRVMKIGRKNQSLSATRLNQLSSRRCRIASRHSSCTQ